MAKRINKITAALWRHKYLLTCFLFVLIVGFLDPNSIWQRYKLSRRNAELRAEIAQYDRRYAADKRELELLESSPSAVEEVARVRLFMKTEDEDVYVVESVANDSTTLR